MSAFPAPSPWYCVALRRAADWLADAAERLEAPPALEHVHRCDAAEERLREMRTRYY